MAKEAINPEPIDRWEGSVEWVEENHGVFISALHFPNVASAVDHVEEVEIPIASLTNEERAKLGKLSCFSCTVELDDTSVTGIKEVRDIVFLQPVPITQEKVARAVEDFAFLSEYSD